MGTAINFDRVIKYYRSQLILSEVSFQVREGECTGLVGVNGAGKTTCIKSLLDFCDIKSGKITIFGVDHRRTVARKNLIYLPEKFTPPYYLTGRDFLRYMADLHHIEYLENEVIAILETLDLDPAALSRPVRIYSKGMGQKLGLAACFLSQKQLMIFDEPMSGLDPKARALLKKHLVKLKDDGKTLFYSTHLLEDIEALCDQVIILHSGKVCFAGTINECCEIYQGRNLEAAYLSCIENADREHV
jgi:ABC-2 type transport system ATP-binding protein